jgi:hypothetical protein
MTSSHQYWILRFSIVLISFVNILGVKFRRDPMGIHGMFMLIPGLKRRRTDGGQMMDEQKVQLGDDVSDICRFFFCCGRL